MKRARELRELQHRGHGVEKKTDREQKDGGGLGLGNGGIGKFNVKETVSVCGNLFV